MAYRYNITRNDGRMCCRSDSLETLCSRCRAKATCPVHGVHTTATAAPTGPQPERKTRAEWDAYFAQLLRDNSRGGVPPAPTFETVLAAKANPGSQSMLAPPLPPTAARQRAAARDGVPEPPSILDAINQHRARFNL